jgi:nucleotide-binding universal stress UspA family protein
MFKKVLFPTDFSAVSMKALEYIKELKEVGTEEIVLLHVIRNQLFYLSEDTYIKNIEEPAEELKKEARQKLMAIAAQLQERGFKVKAVITMGPPYSRILEVAQKETISSIFIGSQGKGLFKKIIYGSVSEAVVRRSNHPVFVIKDDPALKEDHKELLETEHRMPWRIFHKLKLTRHAPSGAWHRQT